MKEESKWRVEYIEAIGTTSNQSLYSLGEDFKHEVLEINNIEEIKEKINRIINQKRIKESVNAGIGRNKFSY